MHASTSPGAAAVLIPNYLVQSILVTLLCCIPSGIVAIIFSSQVNTKLAVGDLQGAAAASKNAKIWCIVGLCIGLVVWLITALYIVLVVILGIAGVAANH